MHTYENLSKITITFYIKPYIFLFQLETCIITIMQRRGNAQNMFTKGFGTKDRNEKGQKCSKNEDSRVDLLPKHSILLVEGAFWTT